MALVPAILYKDEIKKQILYHAYDDEMFLYTGSNGFSTPEISDEGEGIYQYAIVDDKKLIGYFSYALDMYSSNANCFSLFSFDKGNPIIGISVFRELEKLINSFHVHRLEWRMIEGNPVEWHYDRFCQKYSGKKHILKDAIRDKQGVYHADVIYEIII